MRTGPTHLYDPASARTPDCLRQAMNASTHATLSPDLADLTQDLLDDLKTVFGTRAGRVMLLPGSSFGAWEAAIANTLNPGDKVLMTRHGQFTTRWAELARRLGLDVETVDCAWGAGAPTAELARRLGADRHGAIKAVFVAHDETSTGVTSDVAGVRRALDAAFHDALLCVDGLCAVGAHDFRMDAWAVDVAVAGSRGGLMLPAGLGIVAASEKALEAARGSTMRRACFDFQTMLAAHAVGDFPYAPPAPLLHGLRAALDRILGEGLHAVTARRGRLAEGVRRGVAAWGLETVAEHPSLRSDAVTAVRTPHGVDARAVIGLGRERVGAAFGAGLGPLDGKAFRIGHLGDLDEGACLTALALAELALQGAGAQLRLGAGVAAAQEFYAASAPAAALRIAAE